MIRYCTELQSVQYLNLHVVSIQEEEHMKKESMEVLRRIVKREQEFFGIRVIKKDNTSKVRQMINEWNMENCILFANEVNRELGNGGRFWVDTEYFDFAYEERFEEEMLQLIERHMFEWPLGQFRDIHIPLMMLLQGKWGTETAIQFLKELRENGFVENKKYYLFRDV